MCSKRGGGLPTHPHPAPLSRAARRAAASKMRASLNFSSFFFQSNLQTRSKLTRQTIPLSQTMADPAPGLLGAFMAAGWPFTNIYSMYTASKPSVDPNEKGAFSGGPLRPYHDKIGNSVYICLLSLIFRRTYSSDRCSHFTMLLPFISRGLYRCAVELSTKDRAYHRCVGLHS